MRHKNGLLVLALLAASSCSDGASLGPQSIDGVWVSGNSVPGMSLALTLLAQNGSISGYGTWTGEAMPGGDVIATGQSTGRDVVLDMTFEHTNNGVPSDTTFSEHFAGVFTSSNDIVGTTTQNGVTASLHLQRLMGQ